MDAIKDKGSAHSENRSISSLFSTMLDELTRLFRQEMLLAKTEVSEKVSQAATGGAMLVMGGAVVFAGFLVLLYSAVLALSNVVAPWLAALMVGGVVLIAGAIFLMKGRRDLTARNLAPRRTAASLRRDKEMTRYVTSP